MRAAVLLLAALLTLSAAAAATAAPRRTAKPMSAANRAVIDRLARQAVADGAPGFWIGVWDPRRGRYVTAAGRATADARARPADHLRIGSITKTFTATAALQLVARHRLALSDTIARRLPGLARRFPRIAHIRVRQLLGMTSGIADFANGPDGIIGQVVRDPERVWTPRELIAAGVRAGVHPGRRGYSTTNYLILQLMVQRITGRPLQQVIARRIARPLHLGQTRLPAPADAALAAPATQGHIGPACVDELEGDGAQGLTAQTDPTLWNLSYAQGGGGMTSTIRDLGAWAAAGSGDALLPKRLRRERRRLHRFGAPGHRYGLGVTDVAGWYGHSGEVIGWEAFAARNRRTGVTVAMAVNDCGGQYLTFLGVLNRLYPSAALRRLLGG